MITLSAVYVLTGLLFAAFAVLSVGDRANARRFGNALFWALVATSFLAGDRIGDLGNGVVVLGLALLAGFGLLGRGQPATTSPDERRALSDRFGARLFAPALTLPLVVGLGVFLLKHVQVGGQPLLDPKQVTLISLALAAVASLGVALVLLRQPPLAPLQEGRRLMDTVGWAALLPQMLAALGAVFALAGVGELIGQLVTAWIPLDTRLAAVAVYCLGMAAFTVIMGNAFAAFPVLTAGVGLPILINRFGGDPAVICAVGMLSGFCGTLMTPLAANFNLVPPALLELPDRYSVIKTQIPTALPLLIVNVVLMYVLAF
ncbi:DUF979 domain-containing protein [Phenylobacterium sp. VNQ135]|uniref:DUF979 domain-containing protein n=1 Tax=Phenylobacterium sp. VNQ135 TaxID=3400922 RepID=UPI003C0595C5